MTLARLCGLTFLLTLAHARGAVADEPPAQQRVDRHGDLLPDGALLRLGTIRFRHDGSIYAMAYSPDGRRFVTGNAGYHSLIHDASVVVWDAQTGKRIRTWYGHAHVVRSVAISHDNKLVAVVNGYGHFHLYDIATGKEPQRFEIAAPGQAAFTPDGRLLVTDGGKVRRWELASGKELLPLVGGVNSDFGMAVAGDGKTVATYTRGGDVRIWNADGSERCRITIATKGMVASLSRDGKQLACGTFDEAVHVFDAVTGKLRWRTPAGSKGVNWRLSAAAFSPDGRILAGSDSGLTLWDAATGKVLRKRDARYGTMQHAHFAPDGKRIATAGSEAAPRFWDAATLEETLRFEGHQHAVGTALFTPDAKELVTASDEHFVHVWDVKTGRARRVAGGEQAIHSIALARTGSALAVCKSYEWPELWDLHSGKRMQTFRTKSGEMGGGPAQLSADGKTLVAGTGWGMIRRWDAATGQELPGVCKGEIAPTGGDLCHYLRFVVTLDGKSLAATRSQFPDSGVVLWDAIEGTKRRTLAERGGPGAFSPDGRLIAILDSKDVRVIDAFTGVITSQFAADGVRVLCAAFSADGRTLVTGGAAGTVLLWEVATGKLRGQWTGHDAAVRCVAFAPDSRRLASGSDDHTVLIWDPTAGIPRGPLTADERDTLWTSLAGADAKAAYQAIVRLAGDPKTVVPLLKARLRPIAPPDPKQLARWIGMLDSDEFTERQQGTEALAHLGERAESALRETLKRPRTLEQRRRLENLLQLLETRPLTVDQLRKLRSIEVLERADTDRARDMLKALAAGAPEARVTREARAALTRLRRAP